MIKSHTFRALFAFALGLAACAGSPSAPAATPTSAARSAVDVAKDAEVLVGTGCIAAAVLAKDDSIRTKCGAALAPATVLIESAAGAVDTNWSNKAACDLAQAVALIAATAGKFGALPANFAPVLADATVLAGAAVGSSSCASSDAGAE
jgi:hypothetical protein